MHLHIGRILILILFPGLLVGEAARAANTRDVQFELKLTRDANSYHLGEIIEFELTFASEENQKFVISQSNPTPVFGAVTLRLSPSDAVAPRTFGMCWGGIGGSHLSSGPRYLSSEPIAENGELTDWYRFQKPGHYSLSVVSREVSRRKSVDEGGGVEVLDLESNEVQFDILPRDPVWEGDELRAILTKLAEAKYPGDFALAVHRLDLLDSPDSARKLVELYLAAPELEKNSYRAGLSQSFHLDVIIPLLDDALSNPEINPSGLPELLAELQVRKQAGNLVSPPVDPAAWPRWQDGCQKRRKLYDDFLAGYEAILLSRAALHTGRTGDAIYEAWNIAENRAAVEKKEPENLQQLRLAVLAVASDLRPDQQAQFLTSEWKILPHGDLKPLLLNLVSAHHLDAYRYWCEDWPAECSAAILSDALKPGTESSPPFILLMPESAHPELDSVLREQLASPNMLRSSAQSLRVAALVLRAGSRELLPAVRDVLTQSAARQDYNCEVEAYLGGYLLRVAAEEGSRWLTGIFQDGKCGDQVLRLLNTARYSDALVPVAVETLDSRNLAAAGTAAIFLGEHGPPAAEDALWKRLNSFWLLWQDRAAELQTTFTAFDHGIPSQSALLEQSLASGLMQGRNWKLTPAEQGRLRQGCITQQCKEIADGKMHLGL